MRNPTPILAVSKKSLQSIKKLGSEPGLDRVYPGDSHGIHPPSA